MLIQDFSCNTQSTECMQSECVNYSGLELNMDDFQQRINNFPSMDKGRQQNSKIRNWITVWRNSPKV